MPILKKIFAILWYAFVTVSVALLCLLGYAIIAPKVASHRFISLWKSRLGTINDPGAMPDEWRKTVYLRKFSDGWILAAMHHGSCCASSVDDEFNTTVFRDSQGTITVCPDSSPCAAGIEEMGQYWESTSKTDSLYEYNLKFRDEFTRRH